MVILSKFNSKYPKMQTETKDKILKVIIDFNMNKSCN